MPTGKWQRLFDHDRPFKLRIDPIAVQDTALVADEFSALAGEFVAIPDVLGNAAAQSWADRLNARVDAYAQALVQALADLDLSALQTALIQARNAYADHVVSGIGPFPGKRSGDFMQVLKTTEEELVKDLYVMQNDAPKKASPAAKPAPANGKSKEKWRVHLTPASAELLSLSLELREKTATMMKEQLSSAATVHKLPQDHDTMVLLENLASINPKRVDSALAKLENTGVDLSALQATLKNITLENMREIIYAVTGVFVDNPEPYVAENRVIFKLPKDYAPDRRQENRLQNYGFDWNIETVEGKSPTHYFSVNQRTMQRLESLTSIKKERTEAAERMLIHKQHQAHTPEPSRSS